MSGNHPLEDASNDLTYFENSLQNARNNGLEVEWFMDFIHNIKDPGYHVIPACDEATWEWDL